jgi:hypothetical protein
LGEHAGRPPRGARLTGTLAGPGGGRAFSLPVNVDGVHQVLIEQHRTGKIKSHVSKAAVTSPEQAARVAWRVLKDWVEAQLAITEASMATLEQVMLPYLRVDGEVTLYEAYAAHSPPDRNASRARSEGSGRQSCCPSRSSWPRI